MTHTIQADRTALTVAGPSFPETCSLSVSLANRRIWTFRPSDGDVLEDRLTVRWPAALVPRLSGSANLLLLQDGIPVCGPTRVHFDDSGNEFALTEPGTGIPQVINKWGRVGRSFEGRDPALIQDVLGATEDLIQLVKRRAGLDLFITGGTLLGPIRDGRIMPHDDDADLAYLSAHSNPSDIALESFRLEDILQAEGHETVRHSAGHLQIMFPGAALEDRFYVDIFTYFIIGGWLHGTFHAREPERDVRVFPLRPVDVNGRMLPGPASPEQMLAAIYGPGWRTPDPAFRFVTPPPARRRFHGWLNSFDADRENWEDHHRAQLAAGTPAVPSEWARQLARDLPTGSRIMELGCGLGTDARHFARHGHDVLAVDYSRPALEAIAGQALRSGQQLRVTRVNLNSVRQLAPLAKACRGDDAPLHVYARLLLNALEPEGQENVLTFLRHALRAQGGRGRAYLEVDGGAENGAFSSWNAYGPVDPGRLRRQLDLKGLEMEEPAADPDVDGKSSLLRLTIKARTP
ncbi:methyltransferase domain-containing protein [Arthrobacter sp.]|uniref:methyltransferase domain-containing protein n=1 Tax=Arthrobacter sp. TaxID=1667 RepID=UPI002810E68B|nr:methyltransferase domain-containing protein [Arthrobacter sp.]